MSRLQPVLLLLVCGLSTFVHSGNILVVLPNPVYSHTVPFEPVLKELAARGNVITYISSFPLDPTPDGFKQINLGLNLTTFMQYLVDDGLEGTQSLTGFSYELFGFWSFCPTWCKLVVREAKKYLPPTTEHFDIVIAEPFFCQEAIAALGHIYKAPVIAKHPGPVVPSVAFIMGNPHISSYTPNIRLIMGDEMNLFERTWNFVVNIFETVGYYVYILPGQDRVMRKIFSDVPDLPYIGDLLSETALLLTETHFSLNYHRPFLRNILEIGGMGVEHVEPLSEDLETFINGSKSGVIYFSFGSHFHSDTMNDTLAGLMDAFSQLTQRVLFKWSNTNIPNTPNNVHIRKWFPQNSVLAHKNVVLYISHGGLNSIYEAAHHGIPVIGIPLIVDQPHNIRLLRHFGMAELVSVESIPDRVTLINTIRKVLNNPSYRDNAEKRSSLMRDRPLPVLEETAFWIEYVMRNGGQSLKPTAAKLPWYTFIEVDIIGLLIIALVLLSLLPVLVVAYCWRPNRSKGINRTKKTQ